MVDHGTKAWTLDEEHARPTLDSVELSLASQGGSTFEVHARPPAPRVHVSVSVTVVLCVESNI